MKYSSKLESMYSENDDHILEAGTAWLPFRPFPFSRFQLHLSYFAVPTF